ncbi:MAG: chloride channel protein [Fimbriimonadaceae bacterium]
MLRLPASLRDGRNEAGDVPAHLRDSTRGFSVRSCCQTARPRAGTRFHLNNTGFVPLQALPAVLVLGLLVGLMAVAFNRGIMSALEFRDRIKIPRWVYGGAVGLLAGLVLVALPTATGGGHHTAETLLRGEFPAENLLWMLLLLLIVKFFLTITSFSSGVPGGIFAPMLVMGAVLGYGFGVLVNLLPYSLGADPTVFASIGMAAFLAASVRSPLTGVVLIFEMTAEYRLLYALLLCSFVAYVIAERFRNEPIYESLLERDLKKDSSTEHEEGRPNVVDLFIEPDSEMDGKQISELTLPKGCLIVNIERESQHVVPNGRTKIREGDIVTLVSEETTQEEWVKVFESARAP